MLRWFLAFIVVPMAALLVWLAFAPRVPRADFVVASEEPRTLDPARVSLTWEIEIANALFEGLTRLNSETFLPEPAVAAAWEISSDQKTYTFHLRPEARWSNGEPVLAEHFRFAWLRVLDPKVKAQYANLLFVVRGAEAYYQSRSNDDPGDDAPASQVGLAALDDRTLRVELNWPCSYFLDLTSFITFAPLYPPALEKWAYRNGQVLTSTQHRWMRPGNLVCNGAFILTRWDFKQRLWLERNPYYWDAGAIALRSIEIYITSDPDAALPAYETGQVDLVRGLSTTLARKLRVQQEAGQRPDFHLGDRFATYFYRVNCRRPPLDNLALRKALALAIDKEALCARVLGLGETPADSYVPRGALPLMPRQTMDGKTIHYEPPAGLGAGLSYPQRVALARQLLRESGFDRIAATRPLKLAFTHHPDYRRVAEALQAMWEAALGIRVELDEQESKVLGPNIRNLNYDLARSDWFGDYLDPGTFLDMFTTGNGQNRTGWSNADYDRLIAAAARQPDNAQRFALFHEAERILCEEELPILLLFYRRGNYLLNPRFTGLRDNIRDIFQLHRVRRTGQRSNRARSASEERRAASAARRRGGGWHGVTPKAGRHAWVAPFRMATRCA